MPRDWVWTFWRPRYTRHLIHPGSDGMVMRDGMGASAVLWLMRNEERRDWDEIRRELDRELKCHVILRAKQLERRNS